jgi:hypothetical protein
MAEMAAAHIAGESCGSELEVNMVELRYRINFV